MAGLTSLLCLHGGGLDVRQWSGMPARLPGFEVAAPDLPGHGARRGECLTLDGCVAAALDALNGTAAHVVGHSFGGVVALELARRQLGQVRSLLLTGTVGPLTPGQARLMHLAARLPFPPGPALALALRQSRVPQAARPWVREALAATLDPRWQAALVEAMTAPSVPAPLPTPTLLLVGEHETRPARWGVRHLAGKLGGVPAHRVRGVGHVWNLEAPDRFARTVRAWTLGHDLPVRLNHLT